jgi:hypothetical protein
MIKGISAPKAEFLIEKSKTVQCFTKSARVFAVKIHNGLTLAHR